MKDFSNEEWGLVLNGGGGKGSYQIGVFKALFEHHINDCIIAVSGTSSGALNSVLFANGDLNVAVNAWQDITPKSFLQVSPRGDLILFCKNFFTISVCTTLRAY